MWSACILICHRDCFTTRPIWNFLTQVSQTLGSIHSILHRQTATEENDLKKLRASKRRKTIKSVKPPTANPLSISYNISNVSSEDGQLVLSILDYLTEGVIPLLHVFYTVYFDPVDIGEEQLSKELTISAKIANGLIVSDFICCAFVIHVLLLP